MLLTINWTDDLDYDFADDFDSIDNAVSFIEKAIEKNSTATTWIMRPTSVVYFNRTHYETDDWNDMLRFVKNH